MPQAIATAVVSAVGATGTAATLIGATVQIATGLLLSAALAPGGAKGTGNRAQDGRVLFTDAVGARTRHYGRVLVGGQVVFGRSQGGFLHRIVVHGHGEIEAFVELRLDARARTLEADGRVRAAPFAHGQDGSLVRVHTRPGLVPNTPYAGPEAAAPEWGAAHRLDGLWTSYIRLQQRGADKQQTSYPQGATRLQWVADTSRLFDPRTGETAFSDNAALVIADWIEGPEGFDRPGALDPGELIAAADKADQPRALASGGTTRMWRLAGSASMARPPQEVLKAMLDACAGDIRLRPDGRIGLDLGGDPAPVITLGDDDLLEVLAIDDGADALDRFTELPITYVDETLDFVETTADPWVDAAEEARLGETVIGPPLDLRFAPNHAQARHAGKIHAARANPPEQATLRYRLSALPAIYERTVRLDHPGFGLSGAWRVEPFTVSMSDLSLTLVLRRIAGTPAAWSVADEGRPQALPPEPPSEGNPPAAAGHVQAYGQGRTIAPGTVSPGIFVACDPPGIEDTRHYMAYRPGGETAWIGVPGTASDTAAHIVNLIDGAAYDVAVIAARTETYDPDGPEVTDTRILGVQARADMPVPAVPTALTVTDQGIGTAAVEVTASASSFGRLTEILRGGAVIATLRTAPGETVIVADAPGPGAHAWTARAISLSGIASAETPAVPATIT